jgi:hypothetical protein
MSWQMAHFLNVVAPGARSCANANPVDTTNELAADNNFFIGMLGLSIM